MNHEEDTLSKEVVSRLGNESAIRSAYIYQDSEGFYQLGYKSNGFTKREVIAKDAMNGIIASGIGVDIDGRTRSTYPEDIASVACIYADALLAELSKSQGES